MTDRAWKTIFDTYNIHKHNFIKSPFLISANQIKRATSQFEATNEHEPHILCKQDTRESRPNIFKENNLFILPIKNGHYAILEGEGYVDILPITQATKIYTSQLDFHLLTTQVGDSDLQHLDYTYATSLIRSVVDDDSLVLTLYGRKDTPAFSFTMGKFHLNVNAVQIVVDTVYEGRSQIVLVKLINAAMKNLPLFKLYYPYRLLTAYTTKPIKIMFFEKFVDEYGIWIGEFTEPQSIERFQILGLGRWQINASV